MKCVVTAVLFSVAISCRARHTGLALTGRDSLEIRSAVKCSVVNSQWREKTSRSRRTAQGSRTCVRSVCKRRQADPPCRIRAASVLTVQRESLRFAAMALYRV